MLINFEQWRCDWSTVSNPGGPCNWCASFDGRIFWEGEGPQPPLHPNCRCRRVFHHSILVADNWDKKEHWERRERKEEGE